MGRKKIVPARVSGFMLLDEQSEKLERLAKARGMTKAAVLRLLIDSAVVEENQYIKFDWTDRLTGWKNVNVDGR